MIRRVLLSGCALALLTSEAMAQETGTAAQATETPAATAPAPTPSAPSDAPVAPPEAAQPPAAPAEPASPTPAPAPAAQGMRSLRGRAFDKTSNDPVPEVRVIIKGTTKGVETDV